MAESFTHIGAHPAKATDDANFALGERMRGNDGSEYIYVKADGDGITGQGYAAVIDAAWTADMTDNTNGANKGQLVGVARTSFGANQYGWLQVAGKAQVRVAANAAANSVLNTTGTAGELDDGASAGTYNVPGVVLTTGAGGSAETVEGVLNNPELGAGN